MVIFNGEIFGRIIIDVYKRQGQCPRTLFSNYPNFPILDNDAVKIFGRIRVGNNSPFFCFCHFSVNLTKHYGNSSNYRPDQGRNHFQSTHL